MKAVWKNTELAESNQTVLVEGNHYFPPEAVNRQYLKTSHTHTTIPPAPGKARPVITTLRSMVT